MRKQLGVVLHKYAFSETSFVLKVLTPEMGLLSLMAKGSKRPKSPFYGHFDAPHLLELVFSYKEGREMHTLVESTIIANRSHHQQDLMHGAVGAVVRELVLKTLHEGEASQEVFELIDKSLGWLDHQREISVRLSYQFICRLIYRLCEQFGFGIQLENCHNCQQELQPELLHHFDLSEGGFLCMHCQLDYIHDEQPTWLVSLYYLLKSPNLLATGVEDLEVVEEILFKYLQGHLDQKPKVASREYLSQIRKMF